MNTEGLKGSSLATEETSERQAVIEGAKNLISVATSEIAKTKELLLLSDLALVEMQRQTLRELLSERERALKYAESLLIEYAPEPST